MAALQTQAHLRPPPARPPTLPRKLAPNLLLVSCILWHLSLKESRSLPRHRVSRSRPGSCCSSSPRLVLLAPIPRPSRRAQDVSLAVPLPLAFLSY